MILHHKAMCKVCEISEVLDLLRDSGVWRTPTWWTRNGNVIFKRVCSGKERRYKMERSAEDQEDHSCSSALTKAPALNTSNSADTARRVGALQLMKGGVLHDGSVAFNTVQQMEITGTLLCEQEATFRGKSFLQRKPLCTKEAEKITISFHACVKGRTLLFYNHSWSVLSSQLVFG